MYDPNDNTYHVNNLPVPRTRSAQAILGNEKETGLMDTALCKFVLANDDYDDASDALGLTGQVSDLWRKIVKLKASVIDNKRLNGESEDQLIKDLFGHVLLAMYYMHKKEERTIQRHPWLGPATGKAPSDKADEKTPVVKTPLGTVYNDGSIDFVDTKENTDEEWGPNPFEGKPVYVSGVSEEVKQEIRDGILGKYDHPGLDVDLVAARENPTRFAVEMAEQMKAAEWDRRDFGDFHETLAATYVSLNRSRKHYPRADSTNRADC